MREVRYVVDAVVGSSRRNPKTRKQVVHLCSTSPREILLMYVVVINLFDMYIVESATPCG